MKKNKQYVTDSIIKHSVLIQDCEQYFANLNLPLSVSKFTQGYKFIQGYNVALAVFNLNYLPLLKGVDVQAFNFRKHMGLGVMAWTCTQNLRVVLVPCA